MFQLEKETSSEYLGLSNLNLSSTEPRKYIQRKRPRSMATVTDAKTILTSNEPRKTSLSSSRLSELAKVISPTEKRVTIKAPTDELAKTNGSSSRGDDKSETGRIDDKMASSKPASTQNGDEWTEISLNNSPDEIYYNNEMYSDDDDQIPYKPLPSELSPESAGEPGIISTTTTTTTAPKLMAGAVTIVRDDSSSRERRKAQLINQKSLPATMEMNELTMSVERKAEVTRSPSIKGKGKLDGSLANWISRSSAAGETSCISSGENNKSEIQL